MAIYKIVLTEIELSISEAESKSLPPYCFLCGEPTQTYESIRFSQKPWYVSAFDTSAMDLAIILLPLLLFLVFLYWLIQPLLFKKTVITAVLPCCARHSHQKHSQNAIKVKPPSITILCSYRFSDEVMKMRQAMLKSSGNLRGY